MFVAVIKWFGSWIAGGALDRALETVDKHIEAQTDREKLRTEVIRAHMTTRADWMRAGGYRLLWWWSMVSLAHYGSVVAYSMFLCNDCVFGPVSFTIAALPSPMDQWQGWIVLASIGGLGLAQLRGGRL